MDYYETLGVNRNASQDEIKKAYRSLAMKHHPDRGGDTNKFKEIEEAYRTLSDEQKKAEYDNPHAQFGGDGFHFNFNDNGFEQFFGGFGPFGNMFHRHQPRPPRNRDLNFHTRITLEDSFYGKEMVVNFFKADGKEKMLNVKIPPGIQHGMTLRLGGVGDDSVTQAAPGDVLITVEIAPHHEYKRQGDDLIKDIEISAIDAIIGKEINITTIDGKNFTGAIPPGTQPDAFLAIAGQGMPNINNQNSRGRLLLNIKITIPHLTDDQISQLKRIFP